MAVPIGPMYLGPFMLVFVPLWFAWFFFIFREPHRRPMHHVHAPVVDLRARDETAGDPKGGTQDHLHHAA